MGGRGEGEPLSLTEEIIRRQPADSQNQRTASTVNEDSGRERGVTGSAKCLFRPENRKAAGTEVTHKDFKRTITTTLHLSRSAGPGGTNRRH